jgi:hypothetical protein
MRSDRCAGTSFAIAKMSRSAVTSWFGSFERRHGSKALGDMGLRHATGRPYESFVFLLEQLSRSEDG